MVTGRHRIVWMTVLFAVIVSVLVVFVLDLRR